MGGYLQTTRKTSRQLIHIHGMDGSVLVFRLRYPHLHLAVVLVVRLHLHP